MLRVFEDMVYHAEIVVVRNDLQLLTFNVTTKYIAIAIHFGYCNILFVS
jgi:hypothetical protein